MQKSSSSPVSALRRRSFQSTSVVLKNGPVAAVRRTSSSGRDLHDQIRKSSVSSSQPPNGVHRSPVLLPSHSSLSLEDALPRPMAASAFSTGPRHTACISPFVPDLSLVLSECPPEEDTSLPRPAPTLTQHLFPKATNALPAVSYDAFLIQRIEQQNTEISSLRTQLQYYMKLFEEVVLENPPVQSECQQTASQTDPDISKVVSEAATMTDFQPVVVFNHDTTESRSLMPKTPVLLSTKGEVNLPASERRIMNLEAPLSFGSSDISVACNNLAQKYLTDDLLAPARPKPTLVKSQGKSGIYTIQDGDFSVATQNYLLRHKLTENSPRAPARLFAQSIIEGDEEDQEDEEEQQSFHQIRRHFQQDEFLSNDGVMTFKKIQSQQVFLRSPRKLISPKGSDLRRRTDDLDLERLRNLPKLLPKKAISPSFH